mmetsp:Transcript_9606/g.20800  ORF Transcript_9606/g.20800 Transcript_9606/m.20800 type:complete len:234 (-) Transcript_9606:117-818(-)
MGSDAPTKMAEATITLSSSFSGPMKMIFKSNGSDDEYEGIGPIAFGRNEIASISSKSKSNHHRTSKITSPSQSRNTDDINNYDGSGEDYSNNNESHSSFFSSSIGDNISKSFDWALETTMVQNCRNPFEFYCLPIINLPKTRGQSVSTKQQWVQSEEDGSDEEVLRTPVTDSEGDNEESGNEEHRPFVPFLLPLSCEYCGSHSIRKCREFDPNCRRPKTFFPKTKPPFIRRST